MAYEIEEIRTGQEIFYYLLKHHELREETETRLFQAYTANEQIQNMVKSQGELADSSIERYGDVIYLIPREANDYLGYSKAQLKAVLCKSGATDKDYYLSQFVILIILVEFYDGQGSSSKSREFIRAGEILNGISFWLKEGAERVTSSEGGTADIAFSVMLETYEALQSDEKGSRSRKTKEGFLYHILNFLQKQGLLEYVEEDEMIKTTKKLDNFMDWNLLNQNHFRRVKQVLGVEE